MLQDQGQSENEPFEVEEKSENGPRRGHAKTGSYSEKDRKIGHRRIDVEGKVSYKKIETNQLMGSIQLGIQASIGGLTKYPERDLLMQDFMEVETTHFSKHGSKQTPAHSYADFTFRTYAPVAFRYFRDLFGIQPADFLMSVCHEPMRELSNPGASGSIFYLTQDDEFILKTVSNKEAEFLQKLLPGYYMNLQQNPHTTLPKFFGMFCYQCNQKNIRLIAMNNLLPSSIKMHLKFDLKGSTFKRKASRHEKAKKSPTLKDLDFRDELPEGLMMEPETYKPLVDTMRKDCRVLESFKIMDYSLLVGIHNIDLAAKEREESLQMADTQTETKTARKERLVAHSTAMESIHATADPVDIPAELQTGGIPARNHKGERLLLFVGIIDILQSYKLFKKLEHTFKSVIHDGDTISVHRPDFYSKRFMDFMAGEVFKRISSSLKHSPSKRKSVKTKVATSGSGAQNSKSGVIEASQERSGAPPNNEDALSGTAVRSPQTGAGAERLASASSETDVCLDVEGEQPQPPTGPNCYLPAVLRDRPIGGRGRGAPPPVPPRSPRRPTDTSSSRGMVNVPPDVVPDSGSHVSRDTWSAGRGASDALSISEIRLEPRLSSNNSLGTPQHSRSRRSRSATPTWTEGTPSFTESTYSGDQAFPASPSHSKDLEYSESAHGYHETEMVSQMDVHVVSVKIDMSRDHGSSSASVSRAQATSIQ